MHLKGTMKPNVISLFKFCFTLLFGYVLALSAHAAPSANTAPQGTLVIIGGGLRADNAEVWQRIVTLSGGKGARIAVLASASINPEKSGQSIISKLNQYGADAFFVPLGVKLPNSNYRKAAEDPAIVAQIKSASGIYFAGGDQGRITQALLRPHGSTGSHLVGLPQWRRDRRLQRWCGHHEHHHVL